MTSQSITIKPQDHRCRYWAKIVRAGANLPLPSTIDSANGIPGAYTRRGDEEIFPGDFVFEGEEISHRKARGWTYHVSFVDGDGALRVVSNPGADEKSRMKTAGIPAEYLAGAGGVAAMIRLAHAVRLNIKF